MFCLCICVTTWLNRCPTRVISGSLQRLERSAYYVFALLHDWIDVRLTSSAVVCCCCCCCFSHSGIGCQPEKNYFTRWPIPLVVCWTGKKRKKKKYVSAPPPPLPPPRALLVRRKLKISKKSRDASTCLGTTQVGFTQVVSVRLASVQGFLRLVS